MSDLERAIETAARALCRFDGHPKNARFEGRPMWMSSCPAAARPSRLHFPSSGNDVPPRSLGWPVYYVAEVGPSGLSGINGDITGSCRSTALARNR